MSSSFNQPMAVERGRSHELVGSMVGVASSHVLGLLLCGEPLADSGGRNEYQRANSNFESPHSFSPDGRNFDLKWLAFWVPTTPYRLMSGV